jgi:4-amino-4-deoxy-L-arabinose transferase-like glycosyltransferase
VAACGAHLPLIRIAQAVIDTSSILAVYLLARRWLDRWPARLAAAFIALNPFLIYFSGLILSETLFSAMLIWGMTLLGYRPDARRWIGGLVLLVLSIHVRPSASGLPFLLILAGIAMNRQIGRPYNWRRLMVMGTLAIAMTLAALLPWALRNKQVVHAWIWTTTNGGITLYDGLHANASGASDQTFVRSMPELKLMDEVGRSNYFSELAFGFARQNPAEAIRLGLIKIARTWSPIPLSVEYGTDRRLVAVAAIYMVPLFSLVLIGLLFGGASKSAKVFLLVPAVYFTVIHAMSVGSLRYRIPADLPMAVIAGFALQVLLDRVGSPGKPAGPNVAMLTEKG